MRTNRREGFKENGFSLLLGYHTVFNLQINQSAAIRWIKPISRSNLLSNTHTHTLREDCSHTRRRRDRSAPNKHTTMTQTHKLYSAIFVIHAIIPVLHN